VAKTRIEAMDGLAIAQRSVEVVERKGLGHPDTICDMLSERLSVTLSRYYLERYGLILHHNVDKALLTAGRSEPVFGGGKVIDPIDIYLSGRATTRVKGEMVPVEELAADSVRSWFVENMHALDPERHVRVRCLVRAGSHELVDIFLRQHEQGTFLANDTSCGVGYAPFTLLEEIVLGVEEHLNSKEVKRILPAAGEDIKVMGVREDDSIALTISCAFVAKYLNDAYAYIEAKEHAAKLAGEHVHTLSGRSASITVNAADDIERDAVFLTVTGTSAKMGDDGETGRGNRANGLITPLRPMTLEAAAGKNPISHVGKLYNLAARLAAQALVGEIAEVQEAECYLVSQIGAPIDQPKTVLVRARTDEGVIAPETAQVIEEITSQQVSGIGELWKGMIEGHHRVA